MLNLDSKRAKIQFVSFGSSVRTLSKINKFNEYYQTHTLDDARRKFRITKKTAVYYLRQLAKDKSKNKIRGDTSRLFTPRQKIEVLDFYHSFGLVNTLTKFKIQKGIVLRWINLRRNGFLNWEPDKKIIQQLQKPYWKKLRTEPSFRLERNDLLKVISIDEKLYGEINIWTNILMRYRAVKELSHNIPVAINVLCAIAKVSVRGYYHWIRRNSPNKNRWDDNLAQKIKWVRTHNPDYLGCRRVAIKLFNKYKIKIGRTQLGRYLNDMRLTTRPRYIRNFTSASIRKKDLLPTIKNHLLKNRKPYFKTTNKNQKFVCDLSLIYPNKEIGNKIYIYVLMDLYGRYVIDFGFAPFKSTDKLVMNIVSKAIKKHHVALIHSDAGREFRSWEYYHYLELNNVTQSFSRPGKPKDNGCIESFFATLKHELNLRQLIKTKTEQETKDIISKWIHFYNNKRVHSSLNWMTPKAFRDGKKIKVIKAK